MRVIWLILWEIGRGRMSVRVKVTVRVIMREMRVLFSIFKAQLRIRQKGAILTRAKARAMIHSWT